MSKDRLMRMRKPLFWGILLLSMIVAALFIGSNWMAENRPRRLRPSEISEYQGQ